MITAGLLIPAPEARAAQTDANTESKLSASIEGIYWRPAGLDFFVIQPIVRASNAPVGTGASQGIVYAFSPGYQLNVRWQNLRIRWLDLQADSNFNPQCLPGKCFPSQRGPNDNAFSGQPLNSASAWSAMRLQILNLDFLQPLGVDPNPVFSVSFGLQYARIYNGTHIIYTLNADGNDTLDSRNISNLIGFRTGLEGDYPIRSTVRLLGLAAVSLLNGNSHNDASEYFTATSRPEQTGVTSNVIIPAIEIGLKLNYTPAHDFNMWAGFEFLEFHDVLVGQTFNGSGGPFWAQETRQSVSFMGPSLGLTWRFF